MRIYLLLIFSCCLLVNAQNIPKYAPKVHRVLFLLDASGSMKEKWHTETRFETAKKLLVKLIDSVEQKNPNVEFAVRVFGHQFPREQRNCTDSKLLVPFAKNNSEKIHRMLQSISPKGMTPIAYSIAQSATDFPEDERALNSIILITDGEENCNLNPCDAAKQLALKRIALKPFIVGLNFSQPAAEKFNCVGTVFNPKDENSFSNTVGIIIKQTLHTTTTQVNLIDQNGNASITNIPFSLLDAASGKVLYNFVHHTDSKGNSDTLFLNPVGLYDIIVYTTPAVRKNNIELTVGKHNIIAVDAPLGNVTFSGAAANDAAVVVRNNSSIISQQNIGETKQYLLGKYSSEATTLPPTFWHEIIPAPNTKNEIAITGFATLSLSAIEAYTVSLIAEESNNSKRIIEQFELKDNKQFKLQPGNYLLIYKPATSQKTESTKSIKIQLEENKYQSIILR